MAANKEPYQGPDNGRAADRPVRPHKAARPGLPSAGSSISSSRGATPGADSEIGPLDGAAVVRLAKRVVGIRRRRGGGRLRDRPARLVAELAGGRNSSAKPKVALASPNAATLSGNCAPHMPGPEIGSIRTSSGPSLTAPDFRHATSASARHGSRSAWKSPRPQPANETRTKEPTRYKRTPRVIRARSTNLFKDSSTRCFHEFLTMPGRARCCGGVRDGQQR